MTDALVLHSVVYPLPLVFLLLFCPHFFALAFRVHLLLALLFCSKFGFASTLLI